MSASKRVLLIATAGLLAFLSVSLPQEGPQSKTTETVAKPKKKAEKPEEAESAPIPSKFGKKEQPVPEGLPTFRSDVTTINLDVAVVDNKGNFIPNIPAGNFQILEDEVPQKISGFNMGEAR